MKQTHTKKLNFIALFVISHRSCFRTGEMVHYAKDNSAMYLIFDIVAFNDIPVAHKPLHERLAKIKDFVTAYRVCGSCGYCFCLLFAVVCCCCFAWCC